MSLTPYLIFAADGAYYALAYGEIDRDNMMRQCMIETHQPASYRHYETIVRRECGAEQVDPAESVECFRQAALRSARANENWDMVAKLEAEAPQQKEAAE